MKHYIIYTDGACRGNQGKERQASWGFIVYDDVTGKRLGSKSDYLGNRTNNEAELIAMLEAMKWISAKTNTRATIHTDSAYVMNGLLEWMPNWKRNGWKTANKGEVKNKELWQALDKLYDPLIFTIVKVKGHSGVSQNEEVDALCNTVIDDHDFKERFG